MTTSRPPEYIYEDEIDLRELVLTLWRGRWVIVLTTLLAAVVALGISLLLPKQYQAVADVALRQPKITLAASQGLGVQARVPDLKTVTALAQAPEVFQRLAEDESLQAAWAAEDAPLTWERLAGGAEAKAQGKDGVRLVFKDTAPQRAALVANRWAALVVERINERYGWANLSAQLASQAEAAWGAYQEAQAAYLQVLGESQADALQAQLKRAQEDLSCVLSLDSQLARLEDDVVAFLDYLKGLGLPAEATLAPGDVLALVALQQRVLATKVCVSETASLQTQWSADALSALTANEVQALLGGLAQTLRQRRGALPAQQQALEAEIVRLEQALEEEQARLREAGKRRDLAWQTYQSLAALQEQSRALASPENQIALIAAPAVAPETLVSPRVLLNAALAGVLGAVLGVMGVWLVAWWREKPSE